MEAQFAGLELEIFTTDSPETLQYRFRSSTNVLLDGESISIEVVVDRRKMDEFLSEKM